MTGRNPFSPNDLTGATPANWAMVLSVNDGETTTFPDAFTITGLESTPTETTAEQIAPYGGVLQNYTNTSGEVEIQTRVNIPLTVEDVAYPDYHCQTKLYFQLSRFLHLVSF